MSTPQALLLFTQVVDEQDENLGFFVSWIRELAVSGRAIHVLCWRAEASPNLPSNVTVEVLPKGKVRRTLALWSATWKYRNELRTVFVHMIAPVVVASGWLWRLMGLRVILWYTHGDVPWELKVAEKFVHQILSATDNSMRLPTPKKIVTGHGIDLDRYAPTGVTRESLLITVGRISPRKDQIAFVKLCARIREASPERVFKGFIVGEPRLATDAAYAKDVETDIQRRGLQNVVFCIGSKTGSDLIDLYSKSALFVSTSHTGSLDKVVLESLACETPAIAVGESFRGFPGVTIVPDVAGDEALNIALAALEHPTAHPESRAGIAAQADLKRLIQKIDHILYV